MGSDPPRYVTLTDQGRTLLACLDSSRDLLARRLVHAYHTVSDPDLNYLPVTSLFQILFLRAGQESGFVEPGTLAALAGSDGISRRMARACSDAGLDPELFFEKGPEGSRIIPDLPDEPLREIIQRIDRPDIPVPVAGIPLDEFVAMLDHLLGTRVQAAEGCRVTRVGKSAVHYTGTVDVPAPDVVGFVIREVVRDVPLRSPGGGGSVYTILDPACGSGVFLLAAFRYLASGRLPGSSRETIPRVLQDLAGSSVFGTDIDPESVSASRLVLLFSVIEEGVRSGCGIPSPGEIRGICGSLAGTIRCGNALMGPDYFSGKPVYPFNAEERRKVNAFDWTKAFPAILSGGGFDAVIGAPPPYRPFAAAGREEYFQMHYATYASSAGLYGYFIERGLSLLKPGGRIAVLIPGTFLRARHARPLRQFLLTRRIVTIADTGRTRPLPEGNVPVFALSLRNELPGHPVLVVPAPGDSGSLEGHRSGRTAFTLDQGSLDDGGWKLEDRRTTDLLQKILAAGTPLEDHILGEILAGACPVRNNPLIVDTATRNRLTRNSGWCRKFFIPLLRPADIRRFVPEQPERYVLDGDGSRDFRKCRALVRYIEENARVRKDEGGTAGPAETPASPIPRPPLIPQPRDDRPKIIFAEYQRTPAFSIDPDGGYALASSLLQLPRYDPFLAGILNSSLCRFVITHICPHTDRGYHLSPAAAGKIPIYVPDFEKRADRIRHDKMVSLVTHIRELNRYLRQAKTDQERRLVQQEIDTSDVRIDALVYDLYGLTPEEIAVVEQACRSSAPTS